MLMFDAGHAGPDPSKDPSAEYCKKLIEPTLAQPPGLHELEHFLLQRPATQLPICPDVLLWLPPPERHHFCAAFGPLARAFAASVSPSMSMAESEHIMVRDVHDIDVRWGPW